MGGGAGGEIFLNISIQAIVIWVTFVTKIIVTQKRYIELLMMANELC